MEVGLSPIPSQATLHASYALNADAAQQGRRDRFLNSRCPTAPFCGLPCRMGRKHNCKGTSTDTDFAPSQGPWSL